MNTSRKSSYQRHHLLWGGVIATLVSACLFSLHHVYYIVAGLPSGAGTMVAFGRGALYLGLTLHQAPTGIDFGKENSLGKEDIAFHYWFSLQEDGSILVIPIWILIVIPLVFWIRGIRKLRRAERDDEP